MSIACSDVTTQVFQANRQKCETMCSYRPVVKLDMFCQISCGHVQPFPRLLLLTIQTRLQVFIFTIFPSGLSGLFEVLLTLTPCVFLS